MTVIRLRRLLLSFLVLCGLGMASVLLWALASPLGFTVPATSELELTTQPSSQSAPSESLVKQFLPHWKKRLRQPLQDPAPIEPKPVVAKVKSVPLPNVELLGTIADGMQIWAMLQTGPNQLEVCRPGDSIQVGNVTLEIVGVEASQVVLRHQGNEIRLALKQPPRSL